LLFYTTYCSQVISVAFTKTKVIQTVLPTICFKKYRLQFSPRKHYHRT